MRVTFVLPFAGLSGGNKVVAIYARQLAGRGHVVTIVSQPPRPISPRQRLRGLIRERRWIVPNAVRSPYVDDPAFRHIVLDRFRPVTDADLPEADVVIATWWETAEWVAALDARKGRKFYMLQGYEAFPYLPVDRVIATYSLPLNKIAVSGYIRDRLRDNHAINGIPVVANGVDPGHFDVPPRHRSPGLAIGFLYQLHPDKNIGLALDVVRAAQARFPGLRVVAFGSGPPTKGHPLPEGVEFHLRPDQARIPEIYASCDAWLFTSAAEGFGLPILEAMACRTPVIGTRAGAAPDLIDGRNGFLVESTVEAFLEKLEVFAAMDEAAWEAFSTHARQTAEEHSWERATDQLEQILLVD